FVYTSFLMSIGLLRLRVTPLPSSMAGRHPFFFSWGCFIGSTVIMILTQNGWAKALPGLLQYGVLGGLIALSSGHYGKTVFTRSEALGATLLMAAGTLLTARTALRTLTLIDRFALMLFVFCFAWSLTGGKEFSAQMMPITVGCGILLI